MFYYNLFETSTAATYHENIYIFSPTVYASYVPTGSSYLNNTFITHTVDYKGGNVICINTPSSTANNLTFKNNIFYTDKINEDTTSYVFFNFANPGTWYFDNNLYYLSGVGYSHAWLPDNSYNQTPLPSFADWQAYGSNGFDAQSLSSQNPNFTDSSGNYSLQNNSPATLAGVNVGLTHDISGKHVGNPPDIGAFQNSRYISNAFLIGRDTLQGSVALIGDFTIMPHWGNLTISPGTHIKFENGATLHVNGTLNCQSNEESGDIIIDTILSNNQIGSIIFAGALASGSVLKQVTLKHGTGIQCLNGANVDIEHSTLDTGSNGIYIYNSAPRIFSNKITNPTGNGIYGQAFLQRPSIERNTIIKLNNPQNASGIYLTNESFPTITSNDINGFDYGAYLGGGSTAFFFNIINYFHYATPEINNRFTNNNTGIYADSTSTIYAGGGFYNIYGGHNSIFSNNDWNAEALANSHIYADNNYWGGGSQNYHKADSSTIEISDTLSDNPWDLFESEKSNNGRNTANQLKKLTDDISEGLLLEQNGQVDEAIIYYKDLISRDRHVQFSLSELLHIYIMYSRNEILTYFNGFLSNNKYYYRVKKLLADFRIRNNEFNSGIMAYNEIIDNHPSTPEVINAKFEKLFAYLNIEKDKPTASQLLSELKALREDGKEYRERIKIAEFLLAANSGLNKKVNTGKTISTVMSYSVSQNYPNPFNPSTTIRYQIPKPGLVTLKVYDILGREVATLVNENKIEGSYDFSFNASKFASGVYIYQFRVNDYVASKKMILIK